MAGRGPGGRRAAAIAGIATIVGMHRFGSSTLPLLLLAACHNDGTPTTEGPGATMHETGEAGTADETGPDVPTGASQGTDTTITGVVTEDPPTSESAGDSVGETTGEATLTLVLVGAGTVTVEPGGDSCSDPQCSFLLPPGDVTLTATPAAGGTFSGWSGDCMGAAPETGVFVSGETSCTATFVNLPDGALPVAISASREVVRVPADDAPASDSESLLKIVGDVPPIAVTWSVRAADDGSEVASSDQLEYVFTCPAGRRDYDVRATVSDGKVLATLFERRLLTCTLPRSDAGRKVHTADIAQSSYFQNGQIGGVKVMPGDLVRISGAAKADFAFFNFQGEPGQPIHVINDGPVSNVDTSWLMHLINCRHVIIDGLGDDGLTHGIKLANAKDGGQAVFVRNYTQGSNTSAGSTDIEIFGVEVADGPDSGFRIWNGGSEQFNASNWKLENLRLHHNYVHDVAAEGFYVGYYTDNVDLQPTSYPLTDAKVYRNTVKDAGWDGMQFGSCVSGLEVHDNVVTGSGKADMANQRSSLQWNPGNSGAAYGNRFIGGVGVDLQVGCTGGDTVMFGNVFIGSEAGFYVHAGQSKGPRYWLFGNTVGSPMAAGLRLNMTSAPGKCDPGEVLSELHYASNLLVGASDKAWEFAGGTADTENWTVAPNLAWNGDPGELCLDAELAPTCADSAALAGDGATLEQLGLTAAELPGGHFVDVDGRVLAGPSNYGAHQAASD